MKLTLMIEGSAAAIAAVLAILPEGAGVTFPGVVSDDGEDGAPNLQAPQTDSSGLPWDERIHAKTKAINESDGKWRTKRGVSKDLVASVEAELRARGGPLPPVAPVAPAPVMAPPPVMSPPAAPMVTPPVVMAPPPAAPVAPVVMAPPPMPVPTPEPASAPVATPQPAGQLDFQQFMSVLQAQLAAGTVDAAYCAGLVPQINDAFKDHGIPAITTLTDIINNPQQITYASQLMQRDGRWS